MIRVHQSNQWSILHVYSGTLNNSGYDHLWGEQIFRTIYSEKLLDKALPLCNDIEKIVKKV